MRNPVVGADYGRLGALADESDLSEMVFLWTNISGGVGQDLVDVVHLTALAESI